MVLLGNGVTARADLTIAVDVATRTICAAVLRPVGTKAVDAALLLARVLVPEPMRPGWAGSLRMAASRLPHARLTSIDTRMEMIGIIKCGLFGELNAKDNAPPTVSTAQ